MKIYCVLLLLLLNGCLNVCPADGSSMFPSMQNGDLEVFRYISNSYEIKRGDVVSFHKDGIYLCKRVIALPNELIQLKWREVYIDGKYLREPHIVLRQEYTPDYTTVLSMCLDNDEYYVMGDNRRDSHDSRAFGPIKRSDIDSIFLFRLWRK